MGEGLGEGLGHSCSNGSSSFDGSNVTEAYLIAVNIAVGVTSVLSLLGSFAIIATYLAFREIRTLARHLLCCLSGADLVIAAASLASLAIFAELAREEKEESCNSGEGPSPRLRRSCIAQGVFIVFATESAILWTMAVAIYMFVLVVLSRPTLGKKLVVPFHVACWGLPLVLTVWLVSDGFIGYEPGATNGICAITGTRFGRNDSHGSARHSHKVVQYPIALGYEVWLYAAFLVLPVLYITIQCHVRIVRKNTNSPSANTSGRWSTSAPTPKYSSLGDWKLTLVPVLFMVLRVWSIVVDISSYYLPQHLRESYQQSQISYVIGVLESIGNVGQGFANGILFCVFTTPVRKRLWKAFRHCIDSGRARLKHMEPLTEETEDIDGDSVMTAVSQDQLSKVEEGKDGEGMIEAEEGRLCNHRLMKVKYDSSTEFPQNISNSYHAMDYRAQVV